MGAVAIRANGGIESRSEQAVAVATLRVFVKFCLVTLATNAHLIPSVYRRRRVGDADNRVGFVSMTGVTGHGTIRLGTLGVGSSVHTIDHSGVLVYVTCTARLSHLAKWLKWTIARGYITCTS